MSKINRKAGKRAAASVRVTERRAQAIKLRLEGKSYRAIAKDTGVSVRIAFQDVQAVLDEVRREANEDGALHKQLDLARIDDSMVVCLEAREVARTALKQQEGAGNRDRDLHAVGRLMKVEEQLVRLRDQRAKLLGLYAPERVETTVAGVSLDELDARRRLAEENASE